MMTLHEYFQNRMRDIDADVQRTRIEVKSSLEKLWEAYYTSQGIYVTHDALQVLLAQRFESIDQLTQQKLEIVAFRFQAIEKATSVANDALNHRLEGMNEFREQINQQQRLFLLKGEYEAKHQDLMARIDGVAAFARDAKEQHYLYVTRVEQEAYAKDILGRFETVEKARTEIVSRIESLEKFSANLQGRIWALGIGITVLTIAIATVLHFIPV